jgi:hypothetical protein
MVMPLLLQFGSSMAAELEIRFALCEAVLSLL